MTLPRSSCATTIKLRAGGSNYDEWAAAITARITDAGLGQYLTPNPSEYCTEDDHAAGVYLRLSLHRHDLMHLKDAKTTFATWELLRRLYEHKSGSTLLLLYTQMDNLRWIEERGSLADFAAAFLALRRRMAEAGDTTPESGFIIRFLTLLPSRFNGAILHILHASTKGPVFPSFDDVLADLEAVDALHKCNGVRKTVVVAPVMPTCTYCGQDHDTAECYRRQRTSDRRRTTMPDEPTLISPTSSKGANMRKGHRRGRSLPCELRPAFLP
ncbi:hypothetical protein ACHHYP_12382 [Achlya hypogyna]|uniref:Retrotransposon Copia-like N-terminal domain-containing protein n=1 Tax=Achlya hypogyna TaxID=1202772 RepID=A0A1V9YH64_ACHHY|nr:hypothetical protein ACHHYP_12382 [Achlya hypogyna]